MNNNKLSKQIIMIASLVFASLTQVHAIMFNDDMTFTTLNQSMWGAGSSSAWSASTFVGTKWGTYAGDAPVEKSFGDITGSINKNVCVGIDGPWGCGGYRTDIDTRTGIKAGFTSSGQIGLDLKAKASGGSINVSLPVQASITLPDTISQHQIVSISTTGGVQGGASIAAFAPSFSAKINGVFDTENNIYAMACVALAGCVEGSKNINLNAGTFPLLGFDTAATKPVSVFGYGVPLASFGSEKTIHVPTPSNPDGVDDAETPQKEPSPVIGQFTLNNVQDRSGGTVSGNSVALQTNQSIFKAGLSVTGAIEALEGSPGILRNDITLFNAPSPIPDFKFKYTLADFLIGPSLGLQQEFNLDPNLMVRLQFDRPVTRVEPVIVHTTKTCVWSIGLACLKYKYYYTYAPQAVTHNDGIIDFALGTSTSIWFDGEVGQLIGRDYFLDNPLFSNTTSATLDPALQIKLFCAKLTALGEKCLFDNTFQTNGLGAFNVFDKNWVMAGFNDFQYGDVYNYRATPIDNIDPAAVPEPATYLLMLVGLLTMVLTRSPAANHNLPRRSRDSILI